MKSCNVTLTLTAVAFAVVSTFFTNLKAQPDIVKNIDPVDAQGGALKFTGNIVSNGTELFFGADNNVNGIELWKTDGTAAGTQMVYDNLGNGSIYNIYKNNSIVYYIASHNTYGRELWKSDGTAAGTSIVKDIIAGTGSGCSSTGTIVSIGSTIYFGANDGTHGFELWKSDGTDAGTVMVKDINPSGNGMGSMLIAIGSTLYFTADDGSGKGFELYSSDGTVGNATLLKDVNPTAGISGVFGGFTALNGKLLFVGNDGTNGKELWISDNTPAGTQMVKNIDGSASDAVSFTNLAVMGNYVYFYGQETTYGAELWRSDGTAANTTLVKDIWPGNTNHGVPTNITNINGTLYFSAKSAGTGFELWKSDGTDAGTVQVKDINAGSVNSNPSNFTYLNGKVYFTATTDANGTELWETNGTDAGTVMVSDIYPGATGSNPSALVILGSSLYFAANDGTNGIELWSYTPGVSLSVPSTITDLAAKVTSNTSIALSWTDANYETKYEIEKSIGNNTSYANLANTDADFTTYSATGLTPGVSYYFRIREMNAAGYSAYSNEISITIPVVPAPTISILLTSATSIVLNWESIANINAYLIERSVSNNTSYSSFGTAGAYATQATASSLTPGTTYYFRVYTRQLVDGTFVYSVYSNEVSITIPVTPPPASPTNFAVTIAGSTANLSWTDVSGETNYVIERSVNSVSNFKVLTSPAADAINYSDAGLLPDSTYYYRLKYISGGQSSFYSHYSNYPYVITVPAIPNNVKAEITATNEVTLSWDDVLNETSFSIQYSTALGGPFTTINPVAMNSTSYKFSSLIAGLTYYYKVQGINSTGGSGYSTLVSVTIPNATISKEIAGSKLITIYPNPVSENLYIESKVSFNHIVITDMCGKQLFSEKLGSLKQANIPVGFLQKGNYLLILKNNQSLVTTQIFVK